MLHLGANTVKYDILLLLWRVSPERPLHGTAPRRQDQFVWFSQRGGYRGMSWFV